MSSKEEKPDIIEPLEGQISFFEEMGITEKTEETEIAEKMPEIAEHLAELFTFILNNEKDRERKEKYKTLADVWAQIHKILMLPEVDLATSQLPEAEKARLASKELALAAVLEMRSILEENRNNRRPDLPRLNSIKPKDAVLNISKIANELTVMGLGQNVALDVGKRGAKRDTTVMVSLAFTNSNVEIISRQPYTGYDRAVYNAICSLWQAGNNSFTPTMVYNAMNGTGNKKTGGATISPQALEAVTRSIEKQRFTRLKIDCSEQMRYYKGLKSAKFDANMLYIEGVEMVMQNGQKVNAYKFVNPDKPPVLYEYSRSIGQVATVSPALLDTSSSIRSTDEIIVIREYLIRRIEGMKGDNNLVSKKISFDAIYFELDIELSELTGNAKKDVPKRIRKNTETLLKHFKKEGYIKDFAEYKDGRTIKGVVISL